VPEFEHRLLRAGYLDADAPFYSSTLFIQEGLYCYMVDERFPRLARAAIPSAIVDGSYSINEKAISIFRQDSNYLREILSRRAGVGNG
jgi:hypothetical protein